MVPAAQTLPNVTQGERPALQELLDVPELVQEQRRVERCMGTEEYRAAESYRVEVTFPASKKQVVKEGVKPGQLLVVKEE